MGAPVEVALLVALFQEAEPGRVRAAQDQGRVHELLQKSPRVRSPSPGPKRSRRGSPLHGREGRVGRRLNSAVESMDCRLGPSPVRSARVRRPHKADGLFKLYERHSTPQISQPIAGTLFLTQNYKRFSSPGYLVSCSASPQASLRLCMARKNLRIKRGFLPSWPCKRTSPMALAIFAHAARGKDRERE